MIVILGAGVTGLAAAMASGFPVYEAEHRVGGICSSYYVRPGHGDILDERPQDGDAYRFEIGGGHWIFGGDPVVLRFLDSLSPLERYCRRSSVFFSDRGAYVPYPLQNHLGYLGKDVAERALNEIVAAPRKRPANMAEGLRLRFGETLDELFFAPFHRLYTAGLWTEIAPQDDYKTPVDFDLVLKGAFDATPPVGYNATFAYPANGLDALTRRLAERCRVITGKRVQRVDTQSRTLYFADGTSAQYEMVLSTLPLNRMVRMAGLSLETPEDPYTSVLVLNVGAERGPECPDDHWLYIPASRSGFHRVGLYSNVSSSFLPERARKERSRVSIYLERAFRGGQRPDEKEIAGYSAEAIGELQDWGFIRGVEAAHANWVEIAYTWSWPGSRWRMAALEELERRGIHQVGRYGRWVFQGIADSVEDGLVAGSALRAGL